MRKNFALYCFDLSDAPCFSWNEVQRVQDRLPRGNAGRCGVRHRNPPVELPADAGAVKAEIARWLDV